MIRLISLISGVVAAAPALAHPGHVAEQAAGHSHWLAYAIFAVLTLALLGLGLSRLVKLRSRPAAEKA